MGNVLSGESAAGILDADTIEDDLRWLTVQGSMIFNDDFLEEEYPNLPDYDGTEVNPVPKGSTAGEHGSDPGGAFREISDGPDGTRNPDIIQRTLQLLGPQGITYAAGSGEVGSGTRGTSVEDFPALLGEISLTASPQAIAARMRARLFQRMHLALLRQAYRAMSSQEASRSEMAGAVATAAAAATATAALSAFAQPPPLSSQEDSEEPTAIMTSASIRMSLNIMSALRGTCPGLFVMMSRTLMDIFTTSTPFSLSKITSPAYVETLSQLRTMAQGAAMADAGYSREERAEVLHKPVPRSGCCVIRTHGFTRSREPPQHESV